MRILRKLHPASVLLGAVLVLCASGIVAPFATGFAEGGDDERSSAQAVVLGSAFTYQGRLDIAGSPANGPYDFEFRLFSDSAGLLPVGAPVLVTTPDVVVTNGLFSVSLSFGATAFAGDARWLGVAVRDGASTGLYTPLGAPQPLTPTPYALFSQSAGFSQSTAAHSHFGDSWIDGTPGSLALEVIGDRGIYLFVNQVGVDVISTGGDAISGYAAGTNKTGVFGMSDRGGRGVLGESTNFAGPPGPRIGVVGRSAPTFQQFLNQDGPYGGSGVYGESMDSFGVAGRGKLAGVFGEGTEVGVLATGLGPVANGVNAVGKGAGASGAGIVGLNTAAAGCASTTPDASGWCLGMFAGAFGGASAGVWGEGQKYGVVGRVSTFIQSESAGILGDKGGGQWAGRFLGPVRVQGALNVEGLLTKSSGAFKIDHPQDPSNKFLYHSFVESPDMKNLYDGIEATGADGFATVEMPTYFEALNMDFRYQLTVIGNGSWARARVYRELDGKSFVIQTDEPNVKVSWQVTGTRKDAYAAENRVVVEVDKTGDEQGTCIYAPACK